ncbi:hypothetical protein J6590_009837 [Homalodisca vitripennis]|nr:hypothetical protein J6590_009837 [Homalodisca vitripennis]
MSSSDEENIPSRKRCKLTIINVNDSDLLAQLVSDGLQSDVPTSIDPDPDSGDEEELLDFDGSDIADPDYEPSDKSDESQNFDESFDGGFKHSFLHIIEL